MTPEYCLWKNDDGLWVASCCSHMFEFDDGGPEANHFSHCPYCGRRLVQALSDEEMAYDA